MCSSLFGSYCSGLRTCCVCIQQTLAFLELGVLGDLELGPLHCQLPEVGRYAPKVSNIFGSYYILYILINIWISVETCRDRVWMWVPLHIHGYTERKLMDGILQSPVPKTALSVFFCTAQSLSTCNFYTAPSSL